MKIMAVEADSAVIHSLQHLSCEPRYEVDIFPEESIGRQDAIARMIASKYDLIVIDISAPQLTGIHLCRELREKGCQTPILLLLESGDSHQVQAALRGGADDYITKPFDVKALMARIEFACHRRIAHHTQPQAEIGLADMSTALSLAVEGIARLDSQGCYFFVNDAYAAMMGYKPAEMIGCDWQRTVYPEDRSAMIKAYEQMLSEGKIEVEARGLRKDESVFDKQLTMISAYDDQQKFVGHYCFMKDVSDRKQTEKKLQQQLNRERLVAEITDAIRQTLDLKQILEVSVSRVRDLLQTDRVIIFRFESQWQGVVEAESVSSDCSPILAMKIQDDCLGDVYVGEYRQGRISNISDISLANVDPYHRNLLMSLQVKANLVVPILQGDHLWGLLIAHHCCEPRQWKPESTHLLQQVAIQIGLAIQQAQLYQTTRRELIERRQIQAALQQSEERFRTLSAFAPVGIYQTDIDGHCTYTNACWQETAGLTFAESLGDKWIQAIHPEDRAKVLTEWTRFIAQKDTFAAEFRFLQPQGEERWVSGRAIAIYAPSGQVMGYVGANEDVTERKLAEQRIREQAALIDIASDAIFVRDLAGKIVFWSKGAARLYGWVAEEAIGKISCQLLKKDRAEVDQALSITMQQGFWQGELRQSTKSGDEILVASRWTLVQDDDGRPQSLLEVNTNITEKKRLEAQFYQAQRLESLGQLAGGIAHDLGNILTPILGIAQLLRVIQKDAEGPIQEYLDILEQSAKRGANMVKQILAFAQDSPSDETTVDILELLQEVIDVARQGFPKSIEIRQINHLNTASQLEASNDLNPSLTAVLADSTQLHQVFMNLCINARDAMPTGGVLTLSVDSCWIDEEMAGKKLSASVGHYVVVTVADTGTGIPSEIRDRIFDPFFTTKSPDKGTGLGLATVSGIVKKAGGFVSVASEIGQGTQMSVYLRSSCSPEALAPKRSY